MTSEAKTPEVRKTVDGHICVISLDNVSKKNAITPELMSQLSAHLTSFEDDDDLWVAVLDPAGEHTTAGLDMQRAHATGGALARGDPHAEQKDQSGGGGSDGMPRA